MDMVKKRYVSTAALFAALCGSVGEAHAAPVAPDVRDVASNFSVFVQSSFTLFGDTDDASLVYYVPVQGGVRVQSPQSANPVPRFSIMARIPSFGFWAGSELTQMGGSLATTGDLGALQQLQNEATAKGLRVRPAPVTKALTSFLIAGQVDPVTGRIDVSCTNDILEVTNAQGVTREVRVPVCKTRDNPDAPYDLDTNVMYKFAFTPLSNNSDASQDLSFQATTLPDITPNLRVLMQTGAQWDSILTSKVDWVVRTENKTRQARAHINWHRLFEQASTFTAFHWNACIDVEITTFFQRIVDCSAENECGIRMEYLQADGRTWGDKAPDDANFVNIVNEVERNLRTELFNEMTPRLGQVSTNASAVFTLRANYERLSLDRNEVRNITYNPGPTNFEAQTKMNITCLKGGYEEGRVSWDLDDPGCAALLGR